MTEQRIQESDFKPAGEVVADARDRNGSHRQSSLVGFRPVTISVSAESHPITLQRAVAPSLMINGLLTNALKHAFPNERPGRVEAQFQKRSSEFWLVVRDNGVGLAGAVRGSGMGQLSACARRPKVSAAGSREEAQPGLQITITFPADPATSQARNLARNSSSVTSFGLSSGTHRAIDGWSLVRHAVHVP